MIDSWAAATPLPESSWRREVRKGGGVRREELDDRRDVTFSQ